MAEPSGRRELVYEEHIDQAIVDDVMARGPANAALWRSVGLDPPSQMTAFRGAIRSDNRETDVTIVGVDQFGIQRTLLIETKITSGFGKGQAESYRNEVAAARMQDRDVMAVIVAPAHFLRTRSGVGCFDGRVPLEELADAWKRESERTQSAAELVDRAVDTTSVDPRTVEFAARLRELLAATGCRLYENSMNRGAWATFAVPPGLTWKTDHGNLDLTAPGWEVEELQAYLTSCDPPLPLEAAPAGKSTVLRVRVDPVDVYAGFDEAIGREVSQRCEQIRAWVADTVEGRQVLDRPTS